MPSTKRESAMVGIHGAEPAAKKAREAGTCLHSAQADAQLWSWPMQVDTIAKQYPIVQAVSDDEGKNLTWQELSQASIKVAAALRDEGFEGMPVAAYPKTCTEVITAPAPVVIMMKHGTDALVVMLGVLRQGFPLLPLSITHADIVQRSQRYRDAMELHAPVAIISDSNLAAELQQLRPIVPVLSAKALLNAQPMHSSYHDVQTTLDNVLAYIFTSGSTGRSKCVTATNRMAWAEVQMYPSLFRDLGVVIDPRKDRFRQDHEQGWWGAAFFGEVDVALAMNIGMAMMKPTDSGIDKRGVTVMGALPSQLQNLFPGAQNIPSSLRAVLCWAERCDVALGEAWKRKGVKMADLLIASEFWLSLASANMEVCHGADGKAAHVMRAISGSSIVVLNDDMTSESDSDQGLLAVGGPQVSPGYVELVDGKACIGSGPLTRDTFKSIAGDWVCVPKDLVKRQPDGGLLNMGRAGGLIKVRGGVLMSTNVAESQLMQRSIAAACITDPVHVEGGQLLALQLARQHRYSLRESLQQAAFLRLPVVFMRSVPRNVSTGKVQKQLVQNAMTVERVAEEEALEELHKVQQTQLQWYWLLARWMALALTCGPIALCFVAALTASVFGLSKPGMAQICFMGPLGVILNVYVFSWIHVSFAYAPLGKGTLSVVVLAYALSCQQALPSLLTAGLLVTIFGRGALYKAEAWSRHTVPWHVEQLRKWLATDFGKKWTKRLSPLKITAAASLLLQVVVHVEAARSSVMQFGLCIWVLVACGRILPRAPCCEDTLSVQRVVALVMSMIETTRFLLCVPLPVLLMLPKLVMHERGSQWGWDQLALLKYCAKPITKKQVQVQYEGPDAAHSQVWSGTYRDGSVWIDLKPTVDLDVQMEDMTESASAGPAVHASTEAGRLGQRLAREAGLDFQGSVDSLRLVRLSVLLKKHMHPLPGEASVELQDLREACVSEQGFVDMVDARLQRLDAHTARSPNASKGERSKMIKAGWNSVRSWAHGGASVHREGATQAPWSCQVDNMLQWADSEDFDFGVLQEACRLAWHAHPLVRTRQPVDDVDDMDMGTSGCGMSTLTASIWALIAAQWSLLASWNGRFARIMRILVPRALWYCWPRMLVLDAKLDRLAQVKQMTERVDSWQANPAEQADAVFRSRQSSWWDNAAAVNNCVVSLECGMEKKHFFYSSITHKYADGGASAAYVHSVGDFYQQLRSHNAAAATEHTPVLEILENRLWRYVSAARCPQGSMDVYTFDIVHDIYDHQRGLSLNVEITPKVCEMMHLAGQCMGVSEEVAWMVCLTCALCRLLPDENIIKILLVHSGRMGDAAGAVASMSQYVMLVIPVARPRAATPLADIASRVSDAITKGLFRRAAPCEQAHMRVNINGVIGRAGPFAQVFKNPSWRWRDGRPSRAAYAIQLRMDKEGPTFSVKDFKCNEVLNARQFWHAVTCIGLEFATGACDDLLADIQRPDAERAEVTMS
mmetsp:Transcript_60797/g.112803  ORF Transcript_60797/g.112803 Transcript_60797/m.112803 type:complete len:1471 (-) Transcript_60797:43-4455(-)